MLDEVEERLDGHVQPLPVVGSRAQRLMHAGHQVFHVPMKHSQVKF
ncbi:Uncharacterised protein [Mycobacterium tuberculosis]|nr:Uncharacterised protein [Mycobacterium tuberculosis]